jgi:predicted nucleotidyltransferase
MRDLIIQKLKEIEQAENIRILHAVESGSRAWGFPSPDSDYDVRFIYVRNPEFYLKLEKTRDVIELPINDMLDINGWDLNKTLRLLHSSNPTLFEWMSSPVIYRQTEFIDQLRPMMDTYFSCKSGLYHYLSMAERNYKEFLQGDSVKVKKYFYVLRPILACKWILRTHTKPPMLFSQLADAELEDSLKPVVDQLLDLKMNTPEIKQIPRVAEINDYLDRTIEKLKAEIAVFPAEHQPDWAPLNQLFLQTLSG